MASVYTAGAVAIFRRFGLPRPLLGFDASATIEGDHDQRLPPVLLLRRGALPDAVAREQPLTPPVIGAQATWHMRPGDCYTCRPDYCYSAQRTDSDQDLKTSPASHMGMGFLGGISLTKMDVELRAIGFRPTPISRPLLIFVAFGLFSTSTTQSVEVIRIGARFAAIAARFLGNCLLKNEAEFVEALGPWLRAMEEAIKEDEFGWGA